MTAVADLTRPSRHTPRRPAPPPAAPCLPRSRRRRSASPTSGESAPPPPPRAFPPGRPSRRPFAAHPPLDVPRSSIRYPPDDAFGKLMALASWPPSRSSSRRSARSSPGAAVGRRDPRRHPRQRDGRQTQTHLRPPAPALVRARRLRHPACRAATRSSRRSRRRSRPRAPGGAFPSRRGVGGEREGRPRRRPPGGGAEGTSWTRRRWRRRGSSLSPRRSGLPGTTLDQVLAGSAVGLIVGAAWVRVSRLRRVRARPGPRGGRRGEGGATSGGFRSGGAVTRRRIAGLRGAVCAGRGAAGHVLGPNPMAVVGRGATRPRG